MAEEEDSGEPEDVEITAFGHRFRTLSGLAEDLITLEREGAIYAHFWDEKQKIFKYYRIPFLPTEIFQYVEAHLAQQQYHGALEAGATFEEALASLSNQAIAERVRSYGDFGRTKLKDGATLDIRGCAASFYGPELEALVCGARPDRYEVLPNLDRIDKASLLIHMLDQFPTVARHLSRRGRGRPPIQIEGEYDVQDLLYACVRSVIADARTEEWTSKHAGTAKRIDIVVPSAEVVLEMKYVRNAAHARSVGDEIKVDIESYHAHSHCKTLLVLVYDPNKLITDPESIAADLSGRRMKGESTFDVRVLIRS